MHPKWLSATQISIMVRMLVADDGGHLFRSVVLQRGLARQVDDGRDPAEPGSVPYCRIGTRRSGRSKAPVMISMRGPSMRPKLRGVPQAAQKPRSAIEEERNAAGVPRVQLTSLRSKSANDANGAPLAFWHIRQWQMLIRTGAADTAKRIAPHWHPPVRVGFACEVIAAPVAATHRSVQPMHRRRQK